MGNRPKDDGPGEEGVRDLLDIIRDIKTKQKAEAHAAWWAQLSEQGRAEYRGSVQAGSQLYRCLGPRMAEFGDGEVTQRLQAWSLDMIQHGPPSRIPRPFSPRERMGSVKRVALHGSKRVRRYLQFLQPLQFDATSCTVRLDQHLPEVEHVLLNPRDSSFFQVMLGVGLVCDMRFSPSLGEYVEDHPEWGGQHWEAASAALPCHGPCTLALRVEVPLGKEWPAGLYVVGTVAIWFLNDRTEVDSYQHIGMGVELGMG